MFSILHIPSATLLEFSDGGEIIKFEMKSFAEMFLRESTHMVYTPNGISLLSRKSHRDRNVIHEHFMIVEVEDV